MDVYGHRTVLLIKNSWLQFVSFLIVLVLSSYFTNIVTARLFEFKLEKYIYGVIVIVRVVASFMLYGLIEYCWLRQLLVKAGERPEKNLRKMRGVFSAAFLSRVKLLVTMFPIGLVIGAVIGAFLSHSLGLHLTSRASYVFVIVFLPIYCGLIYSYRFRDLPNLLRNRRTSRQPSAFMGHLFFTNTIIWFFLSFATSRFVLTATLTSVVVVGGWYDLLRAILLGGYFLVIVTLGVVVDLHPR